MKAIAVSPAKVILFGEHFVVNGNTAISMTIDLPTIVTVEPLAENEIQIRSEDLGLEAVFSHKGQVTRTVGAKAEDTLQPIHEVVDFTLKKLKSECGLRISVKSRVPIGMGLGSSAATAVGTVSAIATLLNSPLTKDTIFEAAYSLERTIHGRPSGIDQATVTYGGLISYRNGKIDATLQATNPPMLIIGNTGKRRSTGEFVGKVTRLRETDPREYSRIASEAQKISENAIDAIRNGQAETLGALMNENQRLLEMVGVSSPDLERLIPAARSAGAFGAKLTGGGGGGCMIALVSEGTSGRVSRSIQEAGGQVVPSEFVPHGVQTSIQED